MPDDTAGPDDTARPDDTAGPEAGPRRRSVLGPVAVTGVLAALVVPAIAGTVTSAETSAVGPGWVLAWLLLGLTAGYALSGSA